MYKKTKNFILLVTFAILICALNVSFAEENSLPKRKNAIYKEYQNLLTVFNNTKDIFSEQPKLSPPNAPGKLTDELLESGLATTNFIRFIAELPSDVHLDEEWTKSSQYAALISAANGKISHTPEKPPLMSDSAYKIARAAAEKSNLYYSYGYSYEKHAYKALYDPILSFMNDSDSFNIKKLNHRRWILNPAMTKIGFGYLKNNTSNHFSAMKVFDDNENVNKSFDYDYIAWPSKTAFPIEFFNNDQAWSIILNSDKYDSTKISSLNVRLKNLSTGEGWVFDRDLSDKNLLYVDDSNYGVPFCVIFRPNKIQYKDGDDFEVTINGVYDKSGNRNSIKFETNFFSLKNFGTTNIASNENEPSSWAARDINILKSKKILKDDSFSNFQNNISRLDFIYLAVKTYEELSNSKINVNSGIKFSDTEDIYALKAASVGITNGIGNNKFGPDLEITREQLATFMTKVIKLAGKNTTLENLNSPYKFTDDEDISSWAKDSVYFVKNKGIVNGVGNDKFSPKGSATVEQALIITKKILELE